MKHERTLILLLLLSWTLTATHAVFAQTYDVYLLTGQSNSLGTTRFDGDKPNDYGPGPDDTDQKISFFWSNVHSSNTAAPAKLYGDSGGKIVPLQMQQGDDGLNRAFWGPEFGFARTLAGKSDSKLLIIKASRGGGGNRYWDKAVFTKDKNAGHMWQHLCNTVDAGLKELADRGDTFTIRGLIYIQGESNNSEEADAAGDRLASIHSDLKQMISDRYPGTADDMKLIIGEIAASDKTKPRQITRDQHKDLAAWNHSIAFVETRDLALQADQIHFDKRSKLVLGERLAEAMLTLDRRSDQRRSDRAQLLNNVDGLKVSGTPATVGVVGPRAMPILIGKSGRQQAAAGAVGRLGQGRVVVFGHTDFLTSPAEGATEQLVLNAVEWAAGKSSGIRLGVVYLGPMPSWLKPLGDQAVMVTRENINTTLPQIDVLIGMASGLDGAEQQVAAFIAQGGGLVLAETGWGWQQIQRGKALSEHPAQGLLSQAGLLITDRYIDAPSVQTASESIDGVTAFAVMQQIIASEAKVDARADGAVALAAAIRCSPDDCALINRLAKIRAASSRALAPRPDAQLDMRDPLNAALITLDARELDRLKPDAGVAHTAAKHFPGAAPADAPRINKTVKVDPSIRGWQSTGLYAQPGEVLAVQVPASMAKGQLTLRIGCHTDSIAHHDKWARMPAVSRAWSIEGQVAKFSNPFGGLVYIERNQPTEGTPFDVMIAGAVQAPYFRLGETDKAAWFETIRNAPAPWAELAGEKVILTIPSEHIRKLNNPDELMALWDRVSDAQADLATIPRERDRPHRFVADVQISAGYMHAGYPIMTHLDAAERMTSIEVMRKGDWGLFHELGHNHQHPEWTFDGTVEVTCNLFTLYTYEKVCEPFDEPPNGGIADQTRIKKTQAHLAKGSPFGDWKSDPFLALAMYLQLKETFGWDAYKKVFAQYRDLPGNQRPRTNEQKRDLWMVMFSNTVNRNLGPFFDTWGVPVSDQAKQAVAGLPDWSPQAEQLGVAPDPPHGFKSLFNGRDLTGWTGGTTRDPLQIRALSKTDAQAWRKKMDQGVAEHWRVTDGQVISDGQEPHLVTEKDYGDFELWVDCKLSANGDSGLYLRGCPQVQIWDPTHKAAHKHDADKGSDGLWNNQKSGRNPSELADKPIGQWNRMYIRMVGPYVTVKLNGKTVVKDAVLENYYDRQRPVPMTGPIHLQTDGGETRFRNIFIREIEAEEANKLLADIAGDDAAYTSLFNGEDLTGWIGATANYEVVDGSIRCRAGTGGNLLTEKEYSDFVVRMEFKLPPGGNNGLAIRSPNSQEQPSSTSLELQILDNTHPMYADLKDNQFHASAYGIKSALRGYLRPVDEWNYQETYVKDDHVKVVLNGYPILDVRLKDAVPQHVSTKRARGHFGFVGHADPVGFRNIRIKELND